MADNVAYTPGSGATIAADDIGGVLHQRVKISLGADNSAADAPGDGTDGMLVNLGANNDVTVAGVATAANQSTIIGHVDGIETVLGTIDADTSALAGAVAGTELQVDIVAALPAGSNLIGSAAAVGDVAHDAADSGNPVSIGAQARTTQPTAVGNADRVRLIADKLGRLVVAPHSVRELVTQATITLSSGTETTLLAAGGAGVFHDITALIVSNTSNLAVRVDFRDTTAGSVVFSLFVAANGGGAVFVPSVPLDQTTANTNWTAQLSSATTDVRIFVQAIKQV